MQGLAYDAVASSLNRQLTPTNFDPHTNYAPSSFNTGRTTSQLPLPTTVAVALFLATALLPRPHGSVQTGSSSQQLDPNSHVAAGDHRRHQLIDMLGPVWKEKKSASGAKSSMQRQTFLQNTASWDAPEFDIPNCFAWTTPTSFNPSNWFSPRGCHIFSSYPCWTRQSVMNLTCSCRAHLHAHGQLLGCLAEPRSRLGRLRLYFHIASLPHALLIQLS